MPPPDTRAFWSLETDTHKTSAAVFSLISWYVSNINDLAFHIKLARQFIYILLAKLQTEIYKKHVWTLKIIFKVILRSKGAKKCECLLSLTETHLDLCLTKQYILPVGAPACE